LEFLEGREEASAMAKLKFLETTDPATRIGEIIGSLLAIGVFCLGGYTVLITFLQ
jgi:hypothetical protein